MIEQAVALVVVLTFALANGINDGGTIMAVCLRTALVRPWLRLLALVVVLAAAPAVLGSRVATTLAERLVVFEGAMGRMALLSAVLATLGVVWVLSAKGWPTSLTLGLIGALAGAGVAAGLPVSWGLLGLVLLVAAIAPALGLVGAVLLHHGARPLLGAVPAVRRALPWTGHLLQSLAYGANDGQKMLAVLAVVAGTSATLPGVPLVWWGAVVAAFTGGTLIGIARIGPTMDVKILPLRTEQVAIATASGAGAVLGSAAVASPVSLIQAVSGGLVGAGVSVTPKRVRWAAVGQIVLAWAITLPAAFGVSALVAGGLNLVLA